MSLSRYAGLVAVAVGGVLLSGCGANIFPVWPANYFEVPPAKLGTFSTTEYEVEIADGADGQPFTVTVIAPTDASGPRPAFIWVLGSNVQPYYHQSLHETLASWGYVVIVPEARPLTFTDFQYHRRNVDLALQAFELGLAGDLDAEIDSGRVGIGGYSIGATMATFAAAEEPRIGAVVLWAPTSSPFWTGVDPEVLWPQMMQPSYFLLAELDHVEPPSGFPKELQAKLAQSAITEYIIPEGLHLYFQQPTGADNPTDPVSSLTRFEQQGIAIERTLDYLDATLGITRE